MIWVFDDTRPWGQRIAESIRAAGGKAQLFEDPGEVSGDLAVFIPRHKPPDRDNHKAMVASLAKRGVRTIPSAFEIDIYDDKIKQHKVLAPFMPRTWIIDNLVEAYDLAAKSDYPIFSKTSAGAGSHNVRVLEDHEQAMEEICACFSDAGMNVVDGPQKGYVYWQEFVPTDHDWRVCLIGRKYAYIIKRQNRKDRPMASGSGDIHPLQELDTTAVAVLDYAWHVCSKCNLEWAGLDIVPHEETRWKVLETTVAWRVKPTARIFERQLPRNWTATKWMGADFFPMIGELIENGDL